jgi:hypothetical protein
MLVSDIKMQKIENYYVLTYELGEKKLKSKRKNVFEAAKWLQAKYNFHRIQQAGANPHNKSGA